MGSIVITQEVSIADLAFAIVNQSYGSSGQEDVFQLIVDLDEYECDLEFTKRLRDHFDGLIRQEEGE